MSRTQILDAVKQLPPNELEDFVNQVLIFQAQRRTDNLPDIELRLLKNIYRKFPPKKFASLNQLREKLEKADLSENEYSELTSLTDSLEEFQARRVKNLVELAKIRGLKLEEMMAQLGIKFPDYG
jgi:Na+/phosphate symporter